MPAHNNSDCLRDPACVHDNQCVSPTSSGLHCTRTCIVVLVCLCISQHLAQHFIHRSLAMSVIILINVRVNFVHAGEEGSGHMSQTGLLLPESKFRAGPFCMSKLESTPSICRLFVMLRQLLVFVSPSRQTAVPLHTDMS